MPSYPVAVGCQVDGSAAAVEAALQDLRNFMAPAPARAIEAWLAEMSVLVAKRKDDDITEEVRLTAYTARLSRYPADVVRQVLLVDSYRFWPAWEELERRCEALTSPRRAMIAALERGPVEPEPVRPARTDGERERARALLAELFPAVYQGMRDMALDEASRRGFSTEGGQ